MTTSSADLGTLPLFVAQARGLFEKQNLKVDISSASKSTIAALLSSGGTDLIQDSNGTAISQALKGRPTVVAYGIASYNSHTELWSSDVATLQDAANLSDCRFATVAPGGASYGYAAYWKQKFGLKCDLVVAQSYDVIAAGVRSGTYTMGVIPRSTVGAVPSGVNVLIKQDTPDYPAIPDGGKQATIAGLLGLADNLQAKREAMVRFERAMIEAQHILDHASPDDLMRDVQQVEIFKAVPEATLRQQIVTARANIWKDPDSQKPGFISEATWTNSLKTYGYWGIQDFSPDNPDVAYDKLIDMSFYAAAEQQ
ncbi:ABC transporter substrate-binding protein [Rhodococcus koreensis]